MRSFPRSSLVFRFASAFGGSWGTAGMPIKIVKKTTSSNKNQTLTKTEPVPLLQSSPSGIIEPKALPPIIDKMAVVLTPKSASLAHEIHSWLLPGYHQ